jgi:hypothetical protein
VGLEGRVEERSGAGVLVEDGERCWISSGKTWQMSGVKGEGGVDVLMQRRKAFWTLRPKGDEERWRRLSMQQRLEKTWIRSSAIG